MQRSSLRVAKSRDTTKFPNILAVDLIVIVKSKSVGIQLAYLYNGNYMWKSFHNFVLWLHLTAIPVNGVYSLSHRLILEELYFINEKEHVILYCNTKIHTIRFHLVYIYYKYTFSYCRKWKMVLKDLFEYQWEKFGLDYVADLHNGLSRLSGLAFFWPIGHICRGLTP